jgi:MFS family permease
MRTDDSMLIQIATLIVATSAIQLASGFFGTFFSLRIVGEGFGAAMTGLVLSSYFAGFTVGALRCNRMIERIGHIRAYAGFAGSVAAATAAMPLLIHSVPWLVLRAVVGFGCAGIFVTTESWLNATAAPSERGRVFATYMVGAFLALALGQLLISRIQVESAAPFSVIVALFAIALVIVSTARAEPPQVSTAARLPYGQLSRTAPIAVAGCGVSGLVSGTFYSLVPAWMQGEGIARGTIALFMLVAVLGALAFQVPVGRLSDRFDRLVVLSALSLGFAATAVALVVLPRSLSGVLIVAAFLGGFMSTLYPVCVADAHDRMPADRVVAISSRLILVSGIGSVLGPLIGTSLVAHFNINGVLYFMAAAVLVLAVVAGAGRAAAKAPRHLERPFDILPPHPTLLPHDPRGTAAETSQPNPWRATGLQPLFDGARYAARSSRLRYAVRWPARLHWYRPDPFGQRPIAIRPRHIGSSETPDLA